MTDDEGRRARTDGVAAALGRRPLIAAGVFARRPPPLAGYVIFTFLVFSLALAYTLPHDLIAARVLEEATAGTPVRVTFASVAFAFPNGYRFTDLRVAPLRSPGSAIDLGDLTVRSPLLGLLVGRPRSASLTGSAFGGTLSGNVSQRGARGALDLDLQDIDLGRALATVIAPPGRVAGRAALELALAGDGRTTQSTQGSVALAVRGLELSGVVVRGLAVPDLVFPDLTLTAQIDGSRLQVKELRASGDALDLGASGEILLREPLAQSVLNLRLNIDVAPAAPPALRMAAALLPRRGPGEKPLYNASGTLGSPILK
jgi:type II secretion system protein N